MNNNPRPITSASVWPFRQHWQGCHFASCTYAAAVDAAALESLAPALARASNKRQAEFLAGREAARLALARLVPQPQPPARHPESRLPVWPDGINGSISHSHGQAVAVVARQDCWPALGLDLERQISMPRAQRLHKAILHSAESKALMADADWDLATQVTCVFSAKESLFKLLNPLTGCYFGFLDAEIDRLDADGSFSIRLLKTLSADWPAGSLLHGQWALFGEGFITITGLGAPPPS